MAALQRLIGLLVVMLAGLSIVVSATAFKLAKPTNASQIVISTTEQAGLTVAAGPNNPGGIVSTGGGQLGLAVNLDTDSTYKLNRIIRVTNGSGASKTVSLSITGAPTGTSVSISGEVGGTTYPTSSWTVPDTQYVDVSLAWTTGAAGSGSMKITVDGK